MKAFLISLFGLTAIHAQVVTLIPVEDLDVYQYTSAPTSSYWTLGINSSRGAELANPGYGLGNHSQKSVLRFNVTPVSTGMTAATVGTAKLRLRTTAVPAHPADGGTSFAGGPLGGTVNLHYQTAAWTRQTMKWSSFQAGNFINSFKIGQTDSSGNVINNTYVASTWWEVDVTAAVKAWLNGTQANHGIVLSSNEILDPWMNVVFNASITNLNTGAKSPYAAQLVVTPAPFELKLTQFTYQTGQVSLTWTSETGKSYIVEESPDLTSTNWLPRQTVAATGATTSITFTATDFAAKRGFYRIKQAP